ncbi:unnamed protein product [Blepharisma stoltei]|uniref:Metallo-beta-lactamase domain-containing protein n=1 Tax=Blepharisma stoltei TaxID=1481888 RepID=A0AAU9KFM2_9CILI|nr:unnamed protein product [Blepharisma stoltei]
MAIVETLPVGPLQCNMVIIADPVTLEAVLIDPGGDADQIIQLIDSRGFKIKQIIITHGHVDHILAAPEIEKHTGAPVYYNANDRNLWLSISLQCLFLGVQAPKKCPPPKNNLEDGDILQVRNGRVIHTPGHTQGSLCFYFEADKLVCTGDTLFMSGVGRTDLPGGNMQQLMQSLHEKVMTLPDDTRVIPGHGPETTIGDEKSSNPFLNLS